MCHITGRHLKIFMLTNPISRNVHMTAHYDRYAHMDRPHMDR